MTPAHRAIKRTTIVIVYLAIFSLIGTGFYYLLRAKPTCNDGIKNQGEEGMDCGSPCSAKCEEIPKIENVRVLEKSFIPTGDGKYDTVVKINNPNAQFGVAGFDYSLNLTDPSGRIVGQQEGTSFILPDQTKYILAFNVPATAAPRNIDFKIRSFRWTKFSQYEEPLVQVYAKEFNMTGVGSNFASLKAKIKNLSGYDFKNIAAKAVIRNQQGIPVALNQTSVNDVRVNEEREIIFNWSGSFLINSDTPEIEIETEINVFDDDNLMKKYGSSDQYKTYETAPAQ